MEKQSYKNHRKFYAPHHFILLPLLFLLLIFGVWKSVTQEVNQLVWILFSVGIFLLLYLTLMVRQHYALELQNRIVRLEFRQRYFELFGTRSDEIENKLEFSQIAALRFAYDEEFKILLDKALNDQWSATEIKKSIKTWRPDLHRI